MTQLWQLKKLSTGETLNAPQKLPENWGPIFGLAGIQEQLGDLSWLGEAYADQGWVVVGDAPAEPAQSTEAELAWESAKKMLQESDWSMLPDVPMTAGNKALWIEYRRALREVRLQSGFPSNIQWPAKPE
jgi:hypothetical protein